MYHKKRLIPLLLLAIGVIFGGCSKGVPVTPADPLTGTANSISCIAEGEDVGFNTVKLLLPNNSLKNITISGDNSSDRSQLVQGISLVLQIPAGDTLHTGIYSLQQQGIYRANVTLLANSYSYTIGADSGYVNITTLTDSTSKYELYVHYAHIIGTFSFTASGIVGPGPVTSPVTNGLFDVYAAYVKL